MENDKRKDTEKYLREMAKSLGRSKSTEAKVRVIGENIDGKLNRISR